MQTISVSLALLLAATVPVGANTMSSRKVQSAPAPAAGPTDLEVRTDVPYGIGGGHPLLLDLFRPRAHGHEPLPVVMLIHGGGWVHRDKGELSNYQAPLFARDGFVTASIDYRLSAEAPFPAALEDCKCAVRWLRTHVSDLGGDPYHIGALGDSAGGHLALLLAGVRDSVGLEGHGGWGEASSAVQAACSWYGPTDLTPAVDQPGYFNPDVTANVCRLLGDPTLECARRASPTSYAASSWPPVLLVQGEEDPVVPVDQAVRLHEALRRVGAEASLVRVAHATHGFGPAGAQAVDPSPAEIHRLTAAFFAHALRHTPFASLR